MLQTSYRTWFLRGLRLAVLVGVAAAGWHAWGVYSRYLDDLTRTAEMQLGYECAARESDEFLRARTNEFGNINIKDICFTGRDFWVSPREISDVRSGSMKFEPSFRPFDLPNSLVVGTLWGLATVLATLACLGTIRLTRWVWG